MPRPRAAAAFVMAMNRVDVVDLVVDLVDLDIDLVDVDLNVDLVDVGLVDIVPAVFSFFAPWLYFCFLPPGCIFGFRPAAVFLAFGPQLYWPGRAPGCFSGCLVPIHLLCH